MNMTATQSKSYTQPPLPFRGNKRMWGKQFTELLKANYSDCDIVVDLFGGSGFCSYLAKKALPDAEVVYNDFDYYVERIKKIPQTNEILQRLAQVVDGIPIKANIGKEAKQRCLDIIRQYENPMCDYVLFTSSKSGFVDIFDMINDLTGKEQPMGNISRTSNINYQSSYTDYLIYNVAK